MITKLFLCTVNGEKVPYEFVIAELKQIKAHFDRNLTKRFFSKFKKN
ncbi:hypothetical protein X927_07665 [Petrotoga mexicana DSM 14811]|uniref:Uncharacterized protein n=1 Tax=Petrotoga mexicana DSM 14811 TaxID=1122954 RepID=A0A2K1P7B0_9BACT|nr:hypothetical protein [Petrotoga mexicana]PNR98688.1 hypothetical protein X927_07665 [Petrotoga mexicana DSM 14811]